METRLTKFPTWLESLNSFVEVSRFRPFVWGYHDCCLFAADAVHVMTGEDPAGSLRGEYDSLRGAMRLVDANGGMEVMCDRLAFSVGMVKILPNQAGRGDIVLVENPFMDALGVVMGREVACAGLSGLTFVSRSLVLAAWRV